MRKSERKVVIPGDELGTIEEFLASKNTYGWNDRVLSKLVGLARYDYKGHEVAVDALKRITLPENHDVVYAKVTQLRKLHASLDILFIENKDRLLPTPFSGTLHVKNVSSSYVKDLWDVLRYGDLVRARIIGKTGPPYILSLKGREFGVIYALCPHCMSPMKKRGFGLLCSQCGKTARKKLSSFYTLS